MGACLSTTRHQTAFSQRYPMLNPHQVRDPIPHTSDPIPQDISHPTWLDELPTHVCSRIARFLSNGKPCLDALRLAETSHFQRNGVLKALSYKFSKECLDNGLETRWAAVFVDQILEIDITSGSYEACAPLLRLLKAPTVRKVTLFGDDAVMRALAESASVKEITLSVTGDIAFETLNEMLYRLNLSHLSLICMSFYDEDDCAFFPLNDPRFVTDFAEACKKLSYLFIDCDHDFPVHPIWTLLKATPSIDKTTLNVDPPIELLPRLRSFKSVEIGSNVSDWKSLVEELGPAVTLLETYCTTDHLSLAKQESDLAKLTNCPNLSDLEICIMNGVEESLLRILPTFGSLRRLAVRWVFALAREDVVENSYPLYHAPAPGVLTSMVTACPNLDRLCLRWVRFSTQEQDGILRIIGNRLQEVELSFNGQEEHTFDRVEAFLRSAVSYNHKLRKICIVEEDRNVRLCDDEEGPGKDKVEEQRSRLLELLSVLRRRARNLDGSDLHDHIANMEAPENFAVEVTLQHEDGSKTVYDS